VAEEIKIGKNAKIGLTEMDEDRDMKDGIWAEITKADPITVDQPTEKWMD
jgi:hypothetical protein